MHRGYLKLHRRIFDHKFWTKSRVFSEFEAWLDLLQQARFEETDTTQYVGDRLVTYGRGQLPASRSFLVKRWGWGDGKVRNFLNRLKADRSITSQMVNGITVITICKYDSYNLSLDDSSLSKNQMFDPSKVHNISRLQSSETSCIANSYPTDDHNIKKDKKDKKKECSRATTAVFAPPTLQQVSEYALELNKLEEAQRFIDFYQSKGWMVGRTKMRDWRAALRRWIPRSQSDSKKPRGGARPNITNFDNTTDYEQF